MCTIQRGAQRKVKVILEEHLHVKLPKGTFKRYVRKSEKLFDKKRAGVASTWVSIHIFSASTIVACKLYISIDSHSYRCRCLRLHM